MIDKISNDRERLPINGDTPSNEVGLMATRCFCDLASNRTAESWAKNASG